MSWLRSRVFRKITGIYCVLSAVGAAAVLLIFDRETSQDREWLISVVTAVWLWGGICFLLPAALVANLIHRLVCVLQLDGTNDDRRHMLLWLKERRDEFGTAARLLDQTDRDQRRYLQQVEQQQEQTGSSLTQLSAVLQAMSEGVIAVDPHERIQFLNGAACKILNLAADNSVGRLAFEAVRNNHFQEVVADAVHEQIPCTAEFRLAKNNVLVSAAASPVPTGGAVLVLQDVTEVRQLESLRRNFVSGVSHELKTPLTVIQACTETLLDGAVDDSTAARKFLRQIEEQSERLLQLILGMLQLARVESGQQIFQQEPVDLCEVSEQVVRTMMPVARGKNISLSTSGPPELFVLADVQAVRTVIGNLVDNALKYTPDGGTVAVELLSSDEAAVLHVRDNGVGIPKAEQPRVFERFYRVERDRNRERGGTGLGLAIVKHLCQAMDADVSLDSAVGRGCTITIRFPFQD